MSTTSGGYGNNLTITVMFTSYMYDYGHTHTLLLPHYEVVRVTQKRLGVMLEHLISDRSTEATIWCSEGG